MKSTALLTLLSFASIANARSVSKIMCSSGPNLTTAAQNLNKAIDLEEKSQSVEGEVNCWLTGKSIGNLNSHTIKSKTGESEVVEACASVNLSISCG